MHTEFNYNIVREIGVISARMYNGTLYRKELNIVSWNHRPPRFDIREWDENHETCRKGIIMTMDEVRTLYKLLQETIANEKEA